MVEQCSRACHPGPVNDVATDRRTQIVQAAVRLMQRRSYEDVQMRDVTVEAGVAIATVYRHFDSKDHLLAAGLLQWSERFPADVRRTRATTSIGELKESYGRAARSFERFPSMYSHLETLRSTDDPTAATLYDEFSSRQNAAFGVSLRRLRPERRARVVAVMDAVLDSSLREWSRGHKTVDDVIAAIDSAADLLLT